MTVPMRKAGASAVTRPAAAATGNRASIQPSRLLGQHDRNAVADRVGELGGARDQLLTLAIVFERALGERTYEDLEQLGIDTAGGTFSCGHDALPAVSRITIARLAGLQITAAWSRPRSRSWRARSR